MLRLVRQEAPSSCCEGAVNGLAVAPNGCKWIRPKDTAQEEEKKVYKVSGFSADTMYFFVLI